MPLCQRGDTTTEAPSDTVRLLIMFASSLRGGAEEYALRLSVAARERGHDVHAAFPLTPATQTLAADFQAAGVSCRNLPISDADRQWMRLRKARYYWAVFFRTRFCLRRIRPDAVLLSLPVPHAFTGGVAACAYASVPTAITFHLASPEERIDSRTKAVFERGRRRGQQWITVAHENAAVLAGKLGQPEEVFTVIPNGVDLSEPGARNPEEDRRCVRQQIRAEEDERLVLTVGRLSRQKGQDLLAEAIPLLLRSHPGLHFVWVGEGEERERLAGMVTDRGIGARVHFIGHTPDVARYYHAADLFAFPSRFEGAPFALLEAMLHGVPIMASRASGIPEVVEDRKHALLCRTDDSCDLFEKIAWALEHPDAMAAFAKAAHARVQDFSVQEMTRRTIDLLDELGQGRPRP